MERKLAENPELKHEMDALVNDPGSFGELRFNGDDGFLEPDESFRAALDEGGDNPLKANDTWALNCLKALMKACGIDTSIDLVDMHPREQVQVLCFFFEMVTKVNRKLYPASTLFNFLSAFARILWRAQEVWIMGTGKDEPIFDLKRSPLFCRICLACIISMRGSRKAGVGVTWKKVAVVALRTKAQVLGDIAMSMGHPIGLLRRVAYYCIFSFGIRGGGELHRLWQADFTFGEDDKGKYVCYVEWYSKNYKCTLTKFQQEHFRDPVKVYNADVYETFT
jgi:hypothetical protein